MFLKYNVGCKRLFISSVILSLILGSAASFGGGAWICLGCLEEYELDYQNKKMWRSYPSCENKKCDHSFPNCPKKMYDALLYKKEYIIPLEVKNNIKILMLDRSQNYKSKIKILEDKIKTQQKEKDIKICDFYKGMTEEFIKEMQIAIFKIFLVEAAAVHKALESEDKTRVETEDNMEETITNIYNLYTEGTNDADRLVIIERASIAAFLQYYMHNKGDNISTLLSVGSEVDEDGKYQQQTDNIVQYICQQLFNHSLIMVSYGSQAHDFYKEDNVYTTMRNKFKNSCVNKGIKGINWHPVIMFKTVSIEDAMFWQKCIDSNIEKLFIGLDHMKELVIREGLLEHIKSEIIIFNKIRSLEYPTFLCREVVEESNENIKTCKIKWCFGQIVVEMDPTSDGINDIQNMFDEIATAEEKLLSNKKMNERLITPVVITGFIIGYIIFNYFRNSYVSYFGAALFSVVVTIGVALGDWTMLFLFRKFIWKE